LQVAGKSGGRGKDAKIKSKSNASSAVIDAAKEAVEKKIEESMVAVAEGMGCKVHNRLCYLKYDGTCGVYTHELAREHAKMLVSIITHFRFSR